MHNIVSFGKRKENLVLALETRTIGSCLRTFKESVKEGATVFLHCDGKIWGSANVVSPYFFSDNKIWANKIYPHRFKIEIQTLLANPFELSDGIINAEFRKQFGPGWAYRFIFSPKPLPKQIAHLIYERVRKAKALSPHQVGNALEARQLSAQ